MSRPSFDPEDRRKFLLTSVLGAAGAGALVPTLLASSVSVEDIDAATLAAAERLAGVTFTKEERGALVADVRRAAAGWATPKNLPNGLAPSFGRLDPAAPADPPNAPRPFERPPEEQRPRDDELAFLDIATIGRLLRSGTVTSTELTRLSLKRLARLDETLHCAITPTKERALARARAADAELAEGLCRGPLHGIPWGAKDIIAVEGYPTTWGAKPFANQVIDSDASVVRRLDAAGAVLVAKLSVGALAMGDVWFGGKTRNPWNPEQGSSGSSAGPAAAVVAGICAFTLGTETLGSIVSPSHRCGATGLRPTFGRVSREGVMALVWSMDKVGPIARSAADCRLVLDVIGGPDGRDRHLSDRPPLDARPLKDLVVAHLEGGFGERAARDRETLEVLDGLGVKTKPVTLPDFPRNLLQILQTEAATAFDEITRDGRIRELVSQGPQAWPHIFRSARYLPAVEFLQASRQRMRLAEETERALDGVDVLVAPTYRGGALYITNFTGHPCLCLPNGFARDGTPRSITFIGQPFGEAHISTVAEAYQSDTEFHLRRPKVR